MNNICSMTFGSSIIFIVGLYHAHFLYIAYNCCVFIDKLSMALASFSDFLTWSNSSFDWLVHFLLPYVFTPYRSVFWISHVCLFLVNAMRRELMVWTLDFFSLVLWSVCLFTPWDVRCPKVLHLSESNALPCKPQRKRPVTKNLSLQISSLKNTLPESIPPLPGLLTTPGTVNRKNFVAFQAPAAILPMSTPCQVQLRPRSRTRSPGISQTQTQSQVGYYPSHIHQHYLTPLTL